MCLLLGRAAAEDQFGRDLGPGAEGADTDIAAREFLRHDDHRRLRQAQPAEILRDRQAENAKLRQFLDDLHRDQFVLQVPVMRVRHDTLFGIAAELVADHLKVFVKAGRPKGRPPVIVAHQRHQPRPRRRAVARGDQRRRRAAGRPACVQVGKARGFPLAHRDAARDLGKVFAKADLKDQRLHLAELALTLDPPGPAAHLAQRLDIGGQPRERMGGELMLFQRGARDLALRIDLRAQLRRRVGQHGFDLRQRGCGQVEKVGHQCGIRHVGPVVRHESAPFLRSHRDRGFAGAAQY